MGRYVAEAKKLEGDNQQILAAMPPEMKAVMKTKGLALMRKMFSDGDYPDRMLVDDMAAGFLLVGEAPTSHGVLPEKFTPARTHVDS